MSTFIARAPKLGQASLSKLLGPVGFLGILDAEPVKVSKIDGDIDDGDDGGAEDQGERDVAGAIAGLGDDVGGLVPSGIGPEDEDHGAGEPGMRRRGGGRRGWIGLPPSQADDDQRRQPEHLGRR